MQIPPSERTASESIQYIYKNTSIQTHGSREHIVHQKTPLSEPTVSESVLHEKILPSGPAVPESIMVHEKISPSKDPRPKESTCTTVNTTTCLHLESLHQRAHIGHQFFDLQCIVPREIYLAFYNIQVSIIHGLGRPNLVPGYHKLNAEKPLVIKIHHPYYKLNRIVILKQSNQNCIILFAFKTSKNCFI